MTEAPRRTVVAVVLAWRGRIGLFKRSAAVAHDQGLWHCISGYVEPDAVPLAQAVIELSEETGLSVDDLSGIVPGPVLTLADARSGDWTVHTFLAYTDQRRLRLDGEHDTYRWVRPHLLASFDGQVTWLSDVVEAVLGPIDRR
ncbi:NUDIX domain-containing protein [Nocardioides sp. BGMRC 2183]|nr:NUDIX domain-containing protein [Nocardioides sp. BGMRC 2183]